MMSVTVKKDPADQLEQLAGDLHSLAFDMREPRRSHAEADRRIDEGERIASAVRRVVRGGAGA